MDLKIRRFMRKPFLIDAVQVTDENMPDVAQWCGGEIRTDGSVKVVSEEGAKMGEKYIKVRVRRALNDRQTQAFVGDWVLFAGTSYKVYTPKAFANSFEEIHTPPAVNDDQLVLALSHLDEETIEVVNRPDVKFQIKTPPATKKEKSA